MVFDEKQRSRIRKREGERKGGRKGERKKESKKGEREKVKKKERVRERGEGRDRERGETVEIHSWHKYNQHTMTIQQSGVYHLLTCMTNGSSMLHISSKSYESVHCGREWNAP